MVNLQSQQEHTDRRDGFRVRAAMPILLEAVESTNGYSGPIHATATSLGPAGISLTTAKDLPVGLQLDARLAVAGSNVPIQLKGKVVWKDTDPETHERKYGLSLKFITPNSRSVYYSLIADSLLDRTKLLERRIPIKLTSELVRFSNRDGRPIVGFFDCRADGADAGPFVVIPPAYGETKTNSLTLAYYLATNGFRVLRYDGTDHVGESDGTIFNITLSAMKRDLLGAIDYLEKRFAVQNVGVVSSSLAGRVAIRAAVEDPRIQFVIGLVSIVDLESTLSAVYRRNLIQGFVEGTIRGTANILGFEVCDRFLGDAVEHEYHTLEGTKNDVRRMKVPLLLFGSEGDVWSRPETLRAIARLAVNAGNNMFIIPDTLHQIYENRTAAQAALKQVVAGAMRCSLGRPVATEAVEEPSLREIAVQSRSERQRMRFLSRFEQPERVEFWRKYLEAFHLVVKSPDFRSLLEMIYDLLGELEGRRVLDAGCGNGNVGAWLMTGYSKEAQRKNGHRWAPFSYVGLDYVPEALRDAQANFKALAAQLTKGRDRRRSLMDWSLNWGDLNMPLPFISDYFDKVCCNLVLSYLDSPSFALREFHRMLKPGGRILVTSMKPAADLSGIFENFAVTSRRPEELEEARKLLNNAGFIRFKESEGHFQFFSAEELQRMLTDAGFRNLQSYVGFAGQVNLVTGDKA